MNWCFIGACLAFALYHANELALQEREAEFRDQSEATNSRVVRWALMQLAVLSLACAWQLSHLRSFFIKQKLT
jgi:hypothetical protein